MKKLLLHTKQILLGGLIAALFLCVDLNDYTAMQYMDYVFWGIIAFFLPLVLFCYWRHRACVLFAILLFSYPVFAGEYTVEICNYYQGYKQRIESYRRDHFKKDEPCDEGIWNKAKEESSKYAISLVDVAVMGTGVVGLGVGGANIARKKATEWLEGSCANSLMSMCSEYRRRHPETVYKTVPVILNEPVGKVASGGQATSCWPCDMAYVVFVVIQSLSNNLSGMMASVAYMALIWGAAFWLIFKAMGMVLTSKGGTYFSQIAGGLLAVIVAAWILKDGGRNLSWLYSKCLSPVMQLGLTFADGIQSSVGMNSPEFASLTGSSQPFYKQLEARSAAFVSSRTEFTDYCGYTPSLSSASAGSESASEILSRWASLLSRQAFPTLATNFSLLTTEAARGEQTLLTEELKAQLLCMTQRFYNQSRPFIATGQSLIIFASRDTIAALSGFETRFPKKFKMWLVGLLLVGIFTYFGFLVAFRIMDIFLRLGFVLVLMPLFVVTAVFSITREYTMKAWTFLFHIIVEFIGLAISASFVMIMVEGAIGFNSAALLNAMAAPYSADYGDNLFNALTQNMTWAFFFLLLCVVLMGEKLMKGFPVVIATLFGVPDSSSKATVGTAMSAMIGSVAGDAVGLYKKAKNTATTAAKNPYKTKETKAQEAEKDLNNKKKRLEEAKRNVDGGQKKLDRLTGTSKEGEAKKDLQERRKDLEKAQKDVDEAQKKATALRKEADAEKAKTVPSHSGYSARRFGYDSGNAVRTGGASAAEAVDKFGSTVGGFLMKSGIGSLAGVPVVLGSKVVSTGIRAGSRVGEVGLKGIGRAGATVQKWTNKIMGKAPPPKKPKP